MALAHLVIAVVADLIFAYALGIIVPVFGIGICCLRMLPAAKRIAGFHGSTVVIELIAYVLYWLLNAASLIYLCYGLNTRVAFRAELKGDAMEIVERVALLRIVCTELELILEALLFYKLLPAMVHSRWFQHWLDSLLQQRAAEGAGNRVAAGSSHVATVHEVETAGGHESMIELTRERTIPSSNFDERLCECFDPDFQEVLRIIRPDTRGNVRTDKPTRYVFTNGL